MLKTEKECLLLTNKIFFFFQLRNIGVKIRRFIFRKFVKHAVSSIIDPENQLYFEYRDDCVEFLDDLLKHKMFHRAKKITVDDKFLKSKKKKSKETEETDGDAGTKSDAATAKGTYLLLRERT